MQLVVEEQQEELPGEVVEAEEEDRPSCQAAVEGEVEALLCIPLTVNSRRYADGALSSWEDRRRCK